MHALCIIHTCTNSLAYSRGIFFDPLCTFAIAIGSEMRFPSGGIAFSNVLDLVYARYNVLLLWDVMMRFRENCLRVVFCALECSRDRNLTRGRNLE